METTKSRTNVFTQVFSVFKSKRFRNFFYLALIVFASFSMLCIDKDNVIRRNYFSFLNDNFIANLITWLGIERYDVTSRAWVLFIIIMTVATVIVLGNIIAPAIVDKKVKNNPNLFSTEKKTRAWYTVLFYGVLVLIAAAILGIAALLGAFRLYSANSTEPSPFISLLTLLAFFVAFTVALFIVIAIIVFIVRIIALACSGKLGKSEEPVAEIVEETAAAAETEPAKDEPAAETVETTEPPESAEPIKEEPEIAPVVTQKEPIIVIDTAADDPFTVFVPTP